MMTHFTRWPVVSVWFALLTVAVWALGTNAAHATPIVFEFSDGTPLDTGKNGIMPRPIDSPVLTLTSLSAQAPKYIVNPDNSSQVIWDGTYVSATTNIASGQNALGIDNSSVGGSSDPQHVNNGESFTFNFDLPVKITQILFASFGSTDEATIEISGIDSVNYTGGGDSKLSPFGEDPIPAGTSITFTNSKAPVAYTGDLTNLPSDNVWRLTSITVEIVPEPSAIIVSGTSIVSLAFMGRRRNRKCQHAG